MTQLIQIKFWYDYMAAKEEELFVHSSVAM